jgi:hypothetical protein
MLHRGTATSFLSAWTGSRLFSQVSGDFSRLRSLKSMQRQPCVLLSICWRNDRVEPQVLSLYLVMYP